MSTRGNRGGARGASLVGRGRGGGTRGKAATITLDGSPKATHVTTVGVKRPLKAAEKGTKINILVNCYPGEVPSQIIIHYDVIDRDEKKLPARVNLAIITQLQTKVAPGIFTPRGVYDGRKNFYSSRLLDFGGQDSMEFHVPFVESGDGTSRVPQATSSRPPKLFKVTLTKVAEVNTEVLRRCVEGKQSLDSYVQTAITALNVAVRMKPNLSFPFNIRSFFTDSETQSIGGLVLWRGYFQSIRPAHNRLLANVDISTGIFHRGGSLIDTCLEILSDHPGVRGQARIQTLKPSRDNGQTGLSDWLRKFIQYRILGLRVVVNLLGGSARHCVLKGLTRGAATDLRFDMDGRSITVAEYYRETRNLVLKHPDIICAEVGQGSIVPLELCTVPKGQPMRKQIPAHKVTNVLDFSKKPPSERLQKIHGASEVLAHQTSEYIRAFGLQISPNTMQVESRVLGAPTLKYGINKKHATASEATPSKGEWNMIDRKFFKPMQIKVWVLIVFDQQRINKAEVEEMMNHFVAACKETGMEIQPTRLIAYLSSNGTNVHDELLRLREKCFTTTKAFPQLLTILLPEGPVANELYSRQSHQVVGVPTQCLKANKCMRGSAQYFANVALKLNVKLGGINVNLNKDPSGILTEHTQRVMVTGADVVHPSPGSEGRPSFTAVVVNVDQNITRWVSEISVQEARQEIIADLQEMVKNVLTKFIAFHANTNPREKAPTRIIFYRDGVSEGQFQHVQDLGTYLRTNYDDLADLAGFGRGCQNSRFFPRNGANRNECDKTGNCPAGTVVDTAITHPLEYDFYLQSHTGMARTTSRPSHYSVRQMHRDLCFSETDQSSYRFFAMPDALQSLTFTLCHLYARSTRSVSIPAPVYYADIVCSRSKNDFAPADAVITGNGYAESSDSARSSEPQTLHEFKDKLKKVHANLANSMYFM
ncbi:argonaute-like protein [Coprinopsis sp. MPI-PUGE-AT-0042]|nr:argonaute-like protein [Coprinopsis sp. MPI-PUGE-AT-0042]